MPKFFCVQDERGSEPELVYWTGKMAQGTHQFISPENNRLITYPFESRAAYPYLVLNFHGELKILGPKSRGYGGKQQTPIEFLAFIPKNGSYLIYQGNKRALIPSDYYTSFTIRNPCKIIHNQKIIEPDDLDEYFASFMVSERDYLPFQMGNLQHSFYKMKTQDGFITLSSLTLNPIRPLLKEFDPHNSCFVHKSQVEEMSDDISITAAYFLHNKNAVIVNGQDTKIVNKDVYIAPTANINRKLLNEGDLIYDEASHTHFTIERIYDDAHDDRKIPLYKYGQSFYIIPQETAFFMIDEAILKELCPHASSDARACLLPASLFQQPSRFKMDIKFHIEKILLLNIKNNYLSYQSSVTIRNLDSEKFLLGSLVGYCLSEANQEKVILFMVKIDGDLYLLDNTTPKRLQVLIDEVVLSTVSLEETAQWRKGHILSGYFLGIQQEAKKKGASLEAKKIEIKKLSDILLNRRVSIFSRAELGFIKPDAELRYKDGTVKCEKWWEIEDAQSLGVYGKHYFALTFSDQGHKKTVPLTLLRLPSNYQNTDYVLSETDPALEGFPPYTLTTHGPCYLKLNDRLRIGGPLGEEISYQGEIFGQNDKTIAFIFLKGNEYLLFSKESNKEGQNIDRLYFPLPILIKNPLIAKVLPHIEKTEKGFKQKVDPHSGLVDREGKYAKHHYEAIFDQSGNAKVYDAYGNVVETYP